MKAAVQAGMKKYGDTETFIDNLKSNTDIDLRDSKEDKKEEETISLIPQELSISEQKRALENLKRELLEEKEAVQSTKGDKELLVIAAVFDMKNMLENRALRKVANGIKSELSTANQLKEELEQRLSNIKEKTNDKKKTNIVDTKKTTSKLNDVVTIEEPTQFYEDSQKQLTESYEIGYKQKVKRLTLKNRKKIKYVFL